MRLVTSRNLSWLYALVVVSALAEGRGGTQIVAPSQALNLAIIVVPTRADAEIVLKQLNGGVDFGVLAKEKSTERDCSRWRLYGRAGTERASH